MPPPLSAFDDRVSAYSVAAYSGRRRAALGGVFTLGSIAAAAADAADWGFAVLILGAAWLAGRAYAGGPRRWFPR